MARAILGILTPLGGGDPIPLSYDDMTVGRRESSDICLSYPNVSSSHCRFLYRMGKWLIEDLRSSNGVKINGERIPPGTPKSLQPGDQISIAKHQFTIEYTPAEGAEFAEELEDIFEKSLMEKAGLEKPKQRRRPAE